MLKRIFISWCIFLGKYLILSYVYLFIVRVKSPEPMEPMPTEQPVESPIVVERPDNLEVDEGEPVTFTCKIHGSPGQFKHHCLVYIVHYTLLT